MSSQCLPELFAERNVRRLASFFRAFSERFLSLSGRDQPQAVFLSPGPSKQNYFEHAYLARYLGFSVVEGSDLTVRDDRVYLKTVEGLKPVDLIMRRIDSELCDPLELRTDSLIGVPGLLQAARAGKVTIGNALGIGRRRERCVLELPAGLCRRLLGEELGDAEHRDAGGAARSASGATCSTTWTSSSCGACARRAICSRAARRACSRPRCRPTIASG